MNLMAGLERFGFAPKEELNILEEQPAKNTKQQNTKKSTEKAELTEKDFLLDKTVCCPVCDKKFKVKAVKNAKVKRMEPDFDLRPRFEYIDTLKYDVTVCPHCGYGAMNRYFEHVSPAQIKLIKANVCSQFKPEPPQKISTYPYEYAVERYKLSLVSTIVKRGKLSEKAYTCLKIAWLRRAELEILPDDTAVAKQRIADCKEEMEGFYEQAYEGFMKAISKEMPPYCGMDTNTIEYMLANMAMYYKKYDVASKLVAKLITSQTASRKMKDKSLELKDEILKEVRKNAQPQK